MSEKTFSLEKTINKEGKKMMIKHELLCLVEEAKREERERILKELRKMCFRMPIKTTDHNLGGDTDLEMKSFVFWEDIEILFRERFSQKGSKKVSE